MRSNSNGREMAECLQNEGCKAVEIITNTRYGKVVKLGSGVGSETRDP